MKEEEKEVAEYLDAVLKKLRAHPLHKERVEMGKLLMQPVGSLSEAQKNRLEELKTIISQKEQNNAK